MDRLITLWLKRHLRRLSADIDLKQINSLVEDNAMLAENLESWAQRERQEGERIGIKKGERIGMRKGRLEMAQATARNLIALGMLNDGQIAQATGLSIAPKPAGSSTRTTAPPTPTTWPPSPSPSSLRSCPVTRSPSPSATLAE